jgi:nonribosomal peptide synthetase protein BlmIV
VCAPGAALINTYGITEGNGVVTQVSIPLSTAGSHAARDCGPPLDEVEVWIEGPDGARLEPQVEGEIVVSGLISAGYVGPAQPPVGTRFTSNGAGPVLYTGDRGVLRADGSLEVRGRTDRQLNIRGQRVDPTEVEAAALSHDGVLDAAVIAYTPAPGETAVALFAAVVENTGVTSGAREPGSRASPYVRREG